MSRAALKLCINHAQVEQKFFAAITLIHDENLLTSADLGGHTTIEEAGMRNLAAAAAALGFIALALALINPVDAAEEDATPHLLTTEELRAPIRRGDAPLILRGSAVSPQPAPEVRPSAERWQVVAGRRLWLVDPVTEDLRACRVRRTTLVGVREIRCLSGSAGRFRRTFGPDFQP
jgi:hypothetical protein